MTKRKAEAATGLQIHLHQGGLDRDREAFCARMRRTGPADVSGDGNLGLAYPCAIELANPQPISWWPCLAAPAASILDRRECIRAEQVNPTPRGTGRARFIIGSP